MIEMKVGDKVVGTHDWSGCLPMALLTVHIYEHRFEIRCPSYQDVLTSYQLLSSSYKPKKITGRDHSV